jgi:hypothetical protein
MTRSRLTSITLFTLGLVGVGVVAGVFQAHGGSLDGDSPVVPVVLPIFFASLLLLLVPGCLFLSDLFPSGERVQDEGDRLWLGVLSHFPLAAGVFNSLVEQVGIAGLDVPRAVLGGIGVTLVCWFLYYCTRDLTARGTPELAKVLWAGVLLLGNLLAIPVYWWLYLRPRPTRQVAVGGV